MEPILIDELKKKNPSWQKITVVILLIGIAAVFGYFSARVKRADSKEDTTQGDTKETISLNRKFSLKKDSTNEALVNKLIESYAKQNAMAKELYDVYKQKSEDDQKTIKRQDSVLKIFKRL